MVAKSNENEQRNNVDIKKFFNVKNGTVSGGRLVVCYPLCHGKQHEFALDSKENFSDKIAENNIVDAQTLNEVKSRIVRLSFNEDVKSLFWIVDNQVTDMIQNEFGDTSTAYNKLKILKTNIMKSLKGNTGNTFAAAGSSSESVDTSSHPDKEKLKEDVRDDSSSTDITDVSTISSSSFSKSDLIAIVREQLKEERQQSEADAAARNDHMSNFSDEQLQKELQRRKVDSQSKAVAKKMFEQQSQASSDS